MWKDAPYHVPLGKMQKQWQSIIHSLEWPKFKTLTAVNAVEDVKLWKLSLIPGGMQNGTATLEDSPATELFGVYLPKGVENSHKNLHKDVNSHFINSCPKLDKPICPSVAEQINK